MGKFKLFLNISLNLSNITSVGKLMVCQSVSPYTPASFATWWCIALVSILSSINPARSLPSFFI